MSNMNKAMYKTIRRYPLTKALILRDGPSGSGPSIQQSYLDLAVKSFLRSFAKVQSPRELSSEDKSGLRSGLERVLEAKDSLSAADGPDFYKRQA